MLVFTTNGLLSPALHFTWQMVYVSLMLVMRNRIWRQFLVFVDQNNVEISPALVYTYTSRWCERDPPRRSERISGQRGLVYPCGCSPSPRYVNDVVVCKHFNSVCFRISTLWWTWNGQNLDYPCYSNDLSSNMFHSRLTKFQAGELGLEVFYCSHYNFWPDKWPFPLDI